MMDMKVLKVMVSALIDSAEHTNTLAWQTAASLSADTYDAVFNIINDIRDGEIDDVDKAMKLLMEASKGVEDDDD